MERNRSWRRLWRKLAAIAVSVLAVLVLCELAVRIIYGEKFGKRPGFYVGDDSVGWRPAPNLDHTFYGPDYRIHVKTDANGYRLGALGEVDFDEQLIVLSGDSYTFGWGVSTDETFASFLDQRADSVSKGTVRVVNLGVGAYGLLQSFDRLGRFLLDHEGARIAAIVVQHSPNDPTDNLNKLGYHLRLWQTSTTSKERSPFHVVNVMSYVKETLRAGDRGDGKDGDERHPFLQDVLFSYQRHGRYVTLPSNINILDMKLSLEGVSEADTDPDITLARESLTDLQRRFMLAAIDILNRLGAGWNIPVLHVCIYSAPAWYESEIHALIAQSFGAGEGIAFDLGTVPARDSYPGPVVNTHGGGHFTREFNAYWAEEMMKRLAGMGILTAPSDPAGRR